MAVAIPEKNGRLAFHPSKLATFMVAVGLFGCATLVAGLVGWFVLPVARGVLDKLGLGLALLFLLRAIGDFRLVGFFKRVRGTRFSTYDSCFYSPLCLGLALGLCKIVLVRYA